MRTRVSYVLVHRGYRVCLRTNGISLLVVRPYVWHIRMSLVFQRLPYLVRRGALRRASHYAMTLLGERRRVDDSSPPARGYGDLIIQNHPQKVDLCVI